MPELEELRRLFAEAVLVTDPYVGEVEFVPPGGWRWIQKVCWFAENVPGIDPCGGDFGPDHLEAAHWIKRQQVERWVKLQYGPYVALPVNLLQWQDDREELVDLAAWDPRNAVPACEKHHRRFDSHRMPTLVVPRLLVPDHVVEFAECWGLETALEDRNPG